WYGNFVVGGGAHCSSTVRKIQILNNIAIVKGTDGLGPLNYKFTVGKDKYANRLFKINTIATHYEFNYNRVDNTITLSFNGECAGKKTFKQKDSQKNIQIDKKADLDIKSIIKFSEDICKEIGLEENKNYYDKCVLTLLKNFNIF
ncbi:hypothetical protein OAC06_07610, partial [Alphaproteobacteria bacterium]|nr:hypothetical protein [Alphaproteobacteria bacterium]